LMLIMSYNISYADFYIGLYGGSCFTKFKIPTTGEEAIKYNTNVFDYSKRNYYYNLGVNLNQKFENTNISVDYDINLSQQRLQFIFNPQNSIQGERSITTDWYSINHLFNLNYFQQIAKTNKRIKLSFGMGFFTNRASSAETKNPYNNTLYQQDKYWSREEFGKSNGVQALISPKISIILPNDSFGEIVFSIQYQKPLNPLNEYQYEIGGSNARYKAILSPSYLNILLNAGYYFRRVKK